MQAKAKTLVAGLAALVALGASASASAQANWNLVYRRDAGAVYALAMGHPVPLRLYAGWPSWLGTGFQLLVPNTETYLGGPRYRVVEVTACHAVCYLTPSGTWTSWGQVFVAPIGTSGYLHPNAFSWRNTIFYPNADVAISTHVIQRRSQVDLVPFRYGADPAVRGYLHLGDWEALRPGEQLMVLGNWHGEWVQHGDRPTATLVTFESYEYPPYSCYRNSDNPNFLKEICPPVALALSGDTWDGDSGSPVLDPSGRVVGVFVAGVNGYYGLAIPLDPTTGLPIGGIPIQPGP